MRFTVIGVALGLLMRESWSLETEAQRRVHRHRNGKHSPKPIQSLSELLAKSAELTKKFEEQADALRNKVRTSEEADSVTDSDSYEEAVPSFVELEASKRLPSGTGMRAMEEVTEEIMRFTDKMRQRGNEITSFTHH